MTQHKKNLRQHYIDIILKNNATKNKEQYLIFLESLSIDELVRLATNDFDDDDDTADIIY